jgi:excisionase family DNA binding protein
MNMTTARRPRTRLLTVQDVATDLQLSTKTIRRLIDRGDLPVHRLGRSVRVSEEDLLVFTTRTKVMST